MTVRGIDHTADVGFALEAPSLGDLYAEAGRALSDTISSVAALAVDRRIEVRVEAADAEALLVEWLEELLFRFDVDGFLGRRFDVEVRSGPQGGVRIEARIEGTRLDSERDPVKTAVKGATWHGLSVAESEGTWRARVILDV